MYRDLVRLARSAPPGSAQHWLELPYRARAGDGADVLALAMPARTVKGTHASHQFREFDQLWRSDDGPWAEAVGWSGEDPRTSALQRLLTELDHWLRGQPHRLATVEEALDVQVQIEGMLAGR